MSSHFKLIFQYFWMTYTALLTSQILYPSSDGVTTISGSTYEIQQCREFRAIHEYNRKLHLWNEHQGTDVTYPRSMSEASDWVAHDLAICNVDCDAPISCLVTDKCRCSRDRCPDERKASPSTGDAVEFNEKISFDYGDHPNTIQAAVKNLPEESPTLAAKVQALPWDAVIQPSARQTFSLPLTALPRYHIVSLPANVDNHMSSPACHDLSKTDNPTIGDHLILTALRERNVPIQDADFAVIPYFQGCYYNHLKENTYKKLADTVAHAETQITLSEKLKASNIVIPFMHDWGSVSTDFH